MTDFAALFAEFAEPVPRERIVLQPSRAEALRRDMARMARADADRLPWPDAWFDGADPTDGRSCRELWASVFRFSIIEDLVMALKDARRTGAVQPRWLFSRDMLQVADLAGLDPEGVASRLRILLTPLSVQTVSAVLDRFGDRTVTPGRSPAAPEKLFPKGAPV